MGGHVAGEVASQLTVKAIESFVEQTSNLTKDDTWPFPFHPDLSLQANRLKAGIRMANRRLAEEQEQRSTLKGMATTASAVLLGRGPAVIVHVGDSRVYLLRDGELLRLTADHSWVEEQVRAGAMTPSAARRHPWRNVVTRALSGGPEPEVDTREEQLRPSIGCCSARTAYRVSCRTRRLARCSGSRILPRRVTASWAKLTRPAGQTT